MFPLREKTRKMIRNTLSEFSFCGDADSTMHMQNKIHTLNIQIVGKDVSQQVLLNMYFNHVFPLREKTQNLGEPMMLVI